MRIHARRQLARRALSGAVLTVACIASCGDDGQAPPPPNTTAPASWAGVWRFDLLLTDCTTGDTMPGYSSYDTICTGADISQELQELQAWCGGGRFEITATTLRYDCSQSFDQAGCRVTIGVQLGGTLDAEHDLAQGSGQARVDVQPESPACGQSQCATLGLTAHRLAPEPTACRSR